jgi:hypothetical protein
LIGLPRSHCHDHVAMFAAMAMTAVPSPYGLMGMVEMFWDGSR